MNADKSPIQPLDGEDQIDGIVTIPSLQRSMLLGGIGFCWASLCVFSTVAFAERLMYTNLGLYGAYAVWTLLFIMLGGAVFRPLVVGSMPTLKFYLLFGVAFFAYAVGWVGAYFTLRGAVGEWVGSVVGSVLMSVVFSYGFGVLRSALKLSVVLFVANSTGYFFGSMVNSTIAGKAGMMLWGAIYGLFLGVGLGAVLHLAQTRRTGEVKN